MTTMDAIWPQLKPETREWLIAHNGESVPADIVSEIRGLDGPLVMGKSWVDDPSSDSYHFSDDITDWIEKTANGE